MILIVTFLAPSFWMMNLPSRVLRKRNVTLVKRKEGRTKKGKVKHKESLKLSFWAYIRRKSTHQLF